MTAIYQIPLQRIDGATTSLDEYRGRILLIVNVASQCGLTPQYEALQKLHDTYHERGLSVLGFPANDFAQQEPGSNAEVLAFCTSNFGVSFPMFGKIAVTGESQHPLYAALTELAPPASSKAGSDFRDKLAAYGHVPARESDVLWNFEKYLLDAEGEVVARFSPDVAPDDPMLIEAIETALARGERAG